MILLLAKLIKLGWFDDPDTKYSIVPDLTLILHSDIPSHKLIALNAIDQLIVEMTYMTKMKNLQINRRVSLSFRDASLLEIFSNNIKFIRILLN